MLIPKKDLLGWAHYRALRAVAWDTCQNRRLTTPMQSGTSCRTGTERALYTISLNVSQTPRISLAIIRYIESSRSAKSPTSDIADLMQGTPSTVPWTVVAACG